MNSPIKLVALMLILLMCISIQTFASEVCPEPCWEPNDPSLVGQGACQRVSYSENITEPPQAWREPYMSEALEKALSFVLNYFASGNVAPESKYLWHFHGLECCEIDVDYVLGEKIVESENPIVSGQISWAASSLALSVLPSISDRIASGWAGAFPGGIIDQIKSKIESYSPSMNFGEFTGDFSENYTEVMFIDECKGCPDESTYWVGIQSVQGSAAGATLDIPSYQIGDFGIPAIQAKALQLQIYWRKKGELIGTYNKMLEEDKERFLLFAYKVGDGDWEFEGSNHWDNPPIVYGHDICDRW